MRPRRFDALTIASLATFAGTYGVLVATEPGQRLENLALLGAQFRSEVDRAQSLAQLSTVSSVAFGIAFLVFLVIALLGGRGRLGIIAGFVMFGAVVAAQVLKELLPRPELVAGPQWLLRNSFPSGHAAVAAALGLGALLVSPERARWLVLPVGAVFAALIGDATQRTGWHRLSDTVGSVALVLAAASAGVAVAARMGLVRRAPQRRSDTRAQRLLAVIAVVVLLLATVLISLLILFPVLGTPTGARRAFLQAAFPLLGAALTILAFVLFARAIAPYSLGRSEGRPGVHGDASHEPRPTAGDPP